MELYLWKIGQRDIPPREFDGEILSHLFLSPGHYLEAEVPEQAGRSFESSVEDLQAGNDDGRVRLGMADRKRHTGVGVIRPRSASTWSLSRRKLY
jgi:hypothetical protein